MNLFEKNLKKIIETIEKYGSVRDVKICNSSIVITSPSTKDNPKPSVVREIDLNRANEFEIKFILGDERSEID